MLNISVPVQISSVLLYILLNESTDKYFLVIYILPIYYRLILLKQNWSFEQKQY